MLQALLTALHDIQSNIVYILGKIVPITLYAHSAQAIYAKRNMKIADDPNSMATSQ